MVPLGSPTRRSGRDEPEDEDAVGAEESVSEDTDTADDAETTPKESVSVTGKEEDEQIDTSEVVEEQSAEDPPVDGYSRPDQSISNVEDDFEETFQDKEDGEDAEAAVLKEPVTVTGNAKEEHCAKDLPEGGYSRPDQELSTIENDIEEIFRDEEGEEDAEAAAVLKDSTLEGNAEEEQQYAEETVGGYNRPNQQLPTDEDDIEETFQDEGDDGDEEDLYPEEARVRFDLGANEYIMAEDEQQLSNMEEEYPGDDDDEWKQGGKKKKKKKKRKRIRRRLEYDWKWARGMLQHGVLTILFAMIVFAAGFALVTLTRLWMDSGSSKTQQPLDHSNNINNTTSNTTETTIVAPDDGNDPLSSSSETAKLLRFDDFIQFVLDQGWSSGADMKDRKGPQWQACIWLADFDRLNLDFRDESIQPLVLERYAAAVLFFALDGRNWDRDLGWISDVPVCEWFGLTANVNMEQIKIGIDCTCAAADSCDGTTIRRIVLPSMRVKGTVPPELGHLSHLVELDLNHNEISGAFPVGLRTLPNLEIVALHSNQIKGVLPDWLGDMPSLLILKIAENQLNGQIPASLTNLKQLEVLSMSGNKFEGNDVNIFWELESIQLLLASNVGLVGNLTQDFLSTGLPNVQVLDLSDNLLDGTIPTNMLQHKTLAVLDLSQNTLRGPIPDTISEDGSCQLRYLDVSFNNLTGSFPPTMQYAQDLYHINIANNLLTGTFPGYLTQNNELRFIDLSFNDFDAGPIPTGLGDLIQLEHLALQRTNRQGPIDGIQMDQWTKLRNLDLGDNSLNGQVPALLTAASGLQRVILYRNQLTGNFAEIMKHFGHLNSLVVHENAWTQGVQVAALCMPNLEEFIMDHCIRTSLQDDNGSESLTSYCPCCQCCIAAEEDCSQATHYMPDSASVWDTAFVRTQYRQAENDLTVAETTDLLSTGGIDTPDDPEGNTRALLRVRRH